MEIIFWALTLTASLFSLIKAADYFTSAAERIGIHFKISPFIIGVTILAFGTSLPEIATAISAVLQDQSTIVIANVLGSNIANMLLVLGLSAIAAGTLIIKKDIIKVDLPILLAAGIVLYISASDGQFTAKEGLINLLILGVYITYCAKSSPKNTISINHPTEKLSKKDPLILILSLIVIYFGARYTIQSVSELARIFGASTDLIAISAVALGTSLPELIVSVQAARKGKGDLAIGNIIGSNIFNTLGATGISSLFGTLIISSQALSFTLPALIVITILYIFETMEKAITKWEGWILILIYLAFLGKLFEIL